MPALGESIQVWVVRIGQQDPERWRGVLTAAERERAMRFHLPADQNRFTVTRGVLRTLLGQLLEFTENEFGKPAIAGDLRFNVSHSGDYALLAFARNVDVGIDVEHMTDERVVADLATRILSPAEYRRFSQLPDNDKKRTFFQIWTLKESILKGMGTGLSVPPESVEITFYPDEPSARDWTIRSLEIGDDDYAAAIAVKSQNPLIELRHFS